jgi:hypothetical protein
VGRLSYGWICKVLSSAHAYPEFVYGVSFAVCILSLFFTLQYVLSVLKFTYPTVFQGWQTLVGVLILKFLTMKKRLDVAVLDKTTAINLLPHSIYFLGAIVAGSKALTTLVSKLKLRWQNLI